MLEIHVGRGNGGRKLAGGIDAGTQAGLRGTWAKSSGWKMSKSGVLGSYSLAANTPGQSCGGGCAVGDVKLCFPAWGGRRPGGLA